MRVDGAIPLPENLQPQKVERARAGSNPSSTAAVPSSQDQAQLSVSSGNIDQLKAMLASVPEMRQERVEALRQAMSDGSYQVSDQQLADAMHSELLTGDSNTPR
jgi:flagellar biosynthesis anti-sigma factor FlgM